MDTSELVSGKSPLEDPPDISALDSPGSPSLNPSDSFSLLADDSQPDTSLFGNASLAPVLEESVLQGEKGLQFLRDIAAPLFRGILNHKFYGLTLLGCNERNLESWWAVF